MLFSKEFEQKLLEESQVIFEKMLNLAEQSVEKPEFIQQKDVPKYFGGISINTVLSFETKGLKRCEPISGGKIYYHRKELERFMLDHQK
ncbi:hypothetical protein [Enterococcus sp. BWR-S5]|uniref:hypothetical protein n=1 Tax=Enterococcus sp. BWR-S5 TaxID=2787714 RepID=UPI001921C070|nr:hypothetical protein [Enterococcus sp. BWR-S5]MBL1225849.1 DNA-binding protein [Enterococcus sp. BWR-S5]